MNYSEIQIEDLREMILYNSVDPSKLSIDDCAEILYYEVEKEEPNEIVIDYCLKFIETTEEYKSIKVPPPHTFFKKDGDKNNTFYSKRIFKIVATIAAIIILVPSISILTVYAIKAIQEIIYSWQQESLHIHSIDVSTNVITSEEITEYLEIDDVYDNISSLPYYIKDLISSKIYNKYNFIYCRYNKTSDYIICTYMFSNQDVIRITLLQNINDKSYFDLELPKNEDSKSEYKALNNYLYYLFENENELTAVSSGTNIIVTISGFINIEEMHQIIDMIDIPSDLP